MDRGGYTWEATATDADAARMGGRHGAENRERAGAVGRQENPVSESYRVEER